MVDRGQIKRFLESPLIGVVGASSDRGKFGNKVLRCYQEKGYQAIPVHPVQKEIEGAICVASVEELPAEVQSISVITPPQATLRSRQRSWPQVTESVVRQAVEKGIRNIWMQPGAQSPEAVRFCEEQGINLIADGTCVLVELGFREH